MEPSIVLTFSSLQDLSEYLKAEIQGCKKIIDSYNGRLGVLLRGTQKPKEKGASGGKRWVPYGGLLVCGGDSKSGEAEVLFGAIDDLKARVQKLEEAVKAVVSISKIGMGEMPIYTVQFKGGVPRRIVVLSLADADRPRLKFTGEIVIPVASK